MSDLSKDNSEKAVDDLKKLYENAKKKSARDIEASILYDKIEKIVNAHNMTFDGCVDILEIIAPLCDLQTSGGAKKTLQRLVEFLTR